MPPKNKIAASWRFPGDDRFCSLSGTSDGSLSDFNDGRHGGLVFTLAVMLLCWFAVQS